MGTFTGVSQDRFYLQKNKKSHSMPFNFVNNLIVIPVEINGKELSFILDTGIDKSILFNLNITDSIEFNNVEQIKLFGLGEGSSITALKSKKNRVRIGNIYNYDHLVYIILDEQFDLSSKMGIDIHGIIGGELFNNFIVEINYSNKKLEFHDPERYSYKKCKGCETFPLEFYKNKPYINAQVTIDNDNAIDVKLLIDSGGGDALWLFKESNPNISIPIKYFDDFLGKGLSGNIFGKRSKVDAFSIGNFTFENATVSFPDSLSIITAHQNKNRNGTLGAEILKRFNVVFDYQNQLITLKKNKRMFNKPFLYNKSGIELIHGGDMLISEKKGIVIPNNYNEDNNSAFTKVLYTYSLAYKPSYEISLIRKDSPALYAGLKEGDIILEINGKPAYEKRMEEIIHTFSSKEGKKIKMKIERNGNTMYFEFELKNLL
ncbi:MAG: aspartyl protease family protein [Bacteroidota bacterium]